MLAQQSEIIEIDENQVYDAKIMAADFSTEQIRKRSMIDYLGIICAIKYLQANRIKIDTKRSIHKVPFLFEEFKISDLYYGNYRIDVITLFKEKTIKIPKIHMDMEILPHFYFVVQIGSKIKEAKIVGFIDANNIQKCSHDSKFYYPTLDMLFGFDKFLSMTKRSIPTKTLLGKHIDCLGMFLKFIDNDLSSVYKRQLIQHLMNCDSCRARFIDVMEFEKLASNIHHYPKLIRKYEAKNQDENFLFQSDYPTRRGLSLEDALNQRQEQENQEQDKIQEEQNSIVNQAREFEEVQNEGVELIYPLRPDDSKLRTVQMFDIKEKAPKGVITKKIIDTIFKDMPKFELPNLKTIIKAKNKRAIMIGTVILFVLASFALISISGMNDVVNENRDMEAYENYNDNDYPLEFDLPPANGKARLIPKNQSIDDYSINQPISTKPTYSPTITKVAWEAPQSLVKKEAFSKYLKMTGKNVKINLQNDLLLINDVPTNKMAKIEVVLSPIGEVLSVDVYQTSGSGTIDEVVKKAVISTLKYMKPPSLNTDSEESILLDVEMN